MSREEMKSVILDLFDRIRDMNARLAEKDRASKEKDRVIASLSSKLDTLLENQKQERLDAESWRSRQEQWEKEKAQLQKTISDLRDAVDVLKKAKFAGTSQKDKRNKKDDDNAIRGESQDSDI